MTSALRIDQILRDIGEQGARPGRTTTATGSGVPTSTAHRTGPTTTHEPQGW
jgi:hypothetical protein